MVQAVKGVYFSTMFLPLMSSISITAYCYIRSASILSSISDTKSYASQLQIRSLYFYSIVQLITILPALVYSCLNIELGVDAELPNMLTRIPLGLAGFANTLVYFFQRMSKSKVQTPLQENLSTALHVEN